MDKIGLSDQHHQIDGVKILFAGKTSGQISLWIHGGVKPLAQGAHKTKAALDHPTWDTQGFLDQHPNIDLIAHGIKLAFRKTVTGHVT
jgi:hypothetical protein